MENYIKVYKKIKSTLNKLEASVNEYEHYDGKINKDIVESKVGTCINNYSDTLKLMEKRSQMI